MNKKAQIEFMFENGTLDKPTAERILALVPQLVQVALSGPDGKPVVASKVKLDGFGTFKVRAKKASIKPNPQVTAARSLVESLGNIPPESRTAEQVADLEKAEALLAKVASGETKEIISKPAVTKIAFKPEKEFGAWAASGAVPVAVEVEPTEAE